MTAPEPGSSNARIECVIASQLDDTHLGKHVAFYNAGGKRVHGVLRAAQQAGSIASVLTLGRPGRSHFITPTTEVDVITGSSS